MTDSISKTLDVYWDTSLVGSYDKFVSGSERFTYNRKYLSLPTAQPISYSLPLRERPFSGLELRPFFAGLLPEESDRKSVV